MESTKKSSTTKTTKKPQTNSAIKLKELKKEFKQMQQKVTLLELKNLTLKQENEKNLLTFHSKAKEFSTKAKKEITRHQMMINKKAEQEKLHLQKYGSQKLLESILEPLVNLELAVNVGRNQSEPAIQGYVQGFEMLLDDLENRLSHFGVETIEPQPGASFNPELHHILSKDDTKKSNQIVSLRKKGFKLHDRVIKPALVVVGAKK